MTTDSRFQVYPWTNANGLCQVLDDPKVMRGVLAATPNRDRRMALKSCIRRACRGTMDDAATSLRNLLSTDSGRRRLFQRLKDKYIEGLTPPERVLANLLYDWVNQSFSQHIPSLDNVCVERTVNLVKGKFLDVHRLLTWSMGRTFSDEDVYGLALFIAAFTMLQHAEGTQAMLAFAARDERFACWFASATPRQSAADESLPSTFTQPIGIDSCTSSVTCDRSDAVAHSDVPPTVPAPPGESPHVVPTEVSRQEVTISDSVQAFQPPAVEPSCLTVALEHPDQLLSGLRQQPLSKLKGIIEPIGQCITTLRADLLEYDKIREGLEVTLKRMAQNGLVSSSATALLLSPAEETLTDALARIGEVQAKANRVEQLYQRWIELTIRAARPKQKWTGVSTDDLDALAAEVDATASGLEADIRERVRRRAAVNEFIDHLESGDITVARRIIEEAPLDILRDLAHVTADPSPGSSLSDEHDRANSLRNDPHFLGLIVAIIWTRDVGVAIAFVELLLRGTGGERQPLAACSYLRVRPKTCFVMLPRSASR